MESKNLLSRTRSKTDERVVEITLTQTGKDLETKASCVPAQILEAMNLNVGDMQQLKLMSDKAFEQAQNKL